VTKPANVTYATGFLGDDSWAAITGRQVYLLTDSRYTEQAQKECPSCKIIDRAGPMADAVAALVTVEKSTSVAEFERLKKAVKARLRTAENVIETARIVKDQSEIAAIRAAASISARALGQTLSYIKPGVSESELAGMLDFQIRKLGGRNNRPDRLRRQIRGLLQRYHQMLCGRRADCVFREGLRRRGKGPGRGDKKDPSRRQIQRG
jgi:Xaa-Pro aminopeptidase